MRNRLTAGVLAILLFPLLCFGAPTAGQQMQSCVNKYLKGNLTVRFSYSGSMRRGSGTLKSSGSKFALETSAGSTWYDGKTMWTYSPKTGETAVVVPSRAEIAEANPIGLLRTAGSFNAKYASRQTSGSTTIVLTPKSTGSGVRRVVVVLDAKTQKPKKIDVTLSDGGSTVLTVQSLRVGEAHPSSSFRYPKSRYPKAKIVDLR